MFILTFSIQGATMIVISDVIMCFKLKVNKHGIICNILILYAIYNALVL